MGNGIALACAQSGFNVVLFDGFPGALEKARTTISKNISYLESHNKITADEATTIHRRIRYTQQIEDCIGDLIIEAVVEKIDVKIKLFKKLVNQNSSEAVFATNTSSLSVNQIQEQILNPGRFAGLHFFNPANRMKLVEVVKGKLTADETTASLVSFCRMINKNPVICIDSPGFIVNRVARHYYLESLRILSAVQSSPEQIDNALENAGFRMGPFRLMDMIGMDINYTVSQSLYDALNSPERLKPSSLQLKKVTEGKLGRKSGEGFYPYQSPAEA